MRYAIPVLLLLLVGTRVGAQAQISLQPHSGAGAPAPVELIGTWGTSQQCAEARAGNAEAQRLFPYEVSDDWIRQGPIYCYTDWRQQYRSGQTIEAQAFAQCGEDTLREYRIALILSDKALRIHWSPDFATPALRRCD